MFNQELLHTVNERISDIEAIIEWMSKTPQIIRSKTHEEIVIRVEKLRCNLLRLRETVTDSHFELPERGRNEALNHLTMTWMNLRNELLSYMIHTTARAYDQV